MKNIYLIFIIVIATAFTNVCQGQEGTRFDYEILPAEEGNYEITLQLFNPENVQFVEVHFMDGTNKLSVKIASLNKKKDGKYYLFYNNEEKLTSLDNIVLPVLNEFGMLKSPSILLKLVDKDLNLIDSYKKYIN